MHNRNLAAVKTNQCDRSNLARPEDLKKMRTVTTNELSTSLTRTWRRNLELGNTRELRLVREPERQEIITSHVPAVMEDVMHRLEVEALLDLGFRDVVHVVCQELPPLHCTALWPLMMSLSLSLTNRYDTSLAEGSGEPSSPIVLSHRATSE